MLKIDDELDNQDDENEDRLLAYIGLDGKLYNMNGDCLQCPCGSGKNAYGVIIGRNSLYAMCDECNPIVK